jgi:hypothetical protein
VTGAIQSFLMRGFPVRLDGSAQVALFAYDNGVFIVQNFSVRAADVNTTNRYAYAANLGWLDWVADTNNGAVIGEFVCSGYLYSANVGWISLGNGSPTNQIQYQNIPGADLAGTIQLARMSTVWRACGDETKTSSRASRGGAPNSAATN